jgi:hypothetical protein
MGSNEKAIKAVNEKKKEMGKISGQNSLYLDKSFLRRETFLRYLAAIVRHKKR